MKKILFYINSIHEGGAERVMVNLAEYFADENVEVVLLTSYRDRWEYPLSSNVKHLTMEETEKKQSRVMRNLCRIWKLRKACKVEKPDLVVSFMAEPNFRAICATRGLRVKTLVSVRNDPKREYSGKIGALVGKMMLPMADGCVFQTEEAKAWFPKRLQRKSCIIYNAVRKDFYEIKREPICGRIVTCGRLEKQKNHSVLINAFAKIACDYPESQLLIYGDGSLKENLQQQINLLDMGERILLMGTTNDVGSVLGNADVFVLSSDYEGMPNALMEALAVGVPSISTDCPCGGPRMLIHHKKNGEIVPVGDEEALSRALCKLLSDKSYASKLGENAKAEARQYYPTKVFKQWWDYIESMCI